MDDSLRAIRLTHQRAYYWVVSSEQADAVIRGLIEVSLKPSEDFRKVAMEKLSKDQQHDPLLPFSLACRADLDNVDQTAR